MRAVTFIMKKFMFLLLIVLPGIYCTCPSEYDGSDQETGCWTYDTNSETCILSNPSCASVTCGMESMVGTMRPLLFGTTSHESFGLQVNGQACSGLGYNTQTEVFDIDTILFDCNMDVQTIAKNEGNYIKFDHVITKPAQTIDSVSVLK